MNENKTEIKDEIAWIRAHRKLTMADLRYYNEVAGMHFFERSTMRFFDSRVESAPYQGPGGIYFITSEKTGFDSRQRKYTVRHFDPGTAACNAAQKDGFLAHAYIEDARDTARALARGYIPATNQIIEARAREAARPQETEIDQLTRH